MNSNGIRDIREKRIALVYDRVNKFGGAERVLLTLHEMFPEAPLYTSVYNPLTAPWASIFPKIYTSFLQGVPFRSWQAPHEWLALLMPIAFEQFNFDEYDLVISVTSEAAKGVITKPSTRHVCICLTPTRYLWSGYETYFGGGLMRWITRPVVEYLRGWDRVAGQRPDVMVGISREVGERIKRYYGREAEVVYPPVELGNRKALKGNEARIVRGQAVTLPTNVTETGIVTVTENRPYFLLVSRLVPYKKVDLVVEAFNKLGLPLAVIGSGSEAGKLHKIAKNNIYFLENLTDKELASYYEKATALIFPQEEDFGIVAVEAQSFGCPVIAYKAGGALETVLTGRTGEFFWPQTPEALVRVVRDFRENEYNKTTIKQNAKRFSKERFEREFLKILNLRSYV